MSYYRLAEKYLNINDFDDDQLPCIYSLFKNLLYRCHVPQSLIIKCCETGNLQELVNKKYLKTFLNQQEINLNKYLKIIPEEKQEIEIYGDDNCPNCNSEGYITAENCLNMDCASCYRFYCKKCIVSREDNELFYKLNKLSDNICIKCYNIIKKIDSNQKYDLDHFGKKGDIDIETIINMLNYQNYKCYFCNNEVLTMFYKPYCCYQFSIDRINNLLPHNKYNVVISCYYCNCNHHDKFTQKNKKCNAGCHEAIEMDGTDKENSKIIKAFKFDNFTNPALIEYNMNKPIGKIYKSKIAYMCGIPLMMDWLNDKKSDNQFATYIMADPLTGFSPDEFQSKAGTIILFREDQIELSDEDLNYIWNYFAMLMNYTIYEETGTDIVEYESWQGMVQHQCMNKKVWNNNIRAMKESELE